MSVATQQRSVFDSSVSVLEGYLTRGTSVGLLRAALRIRGWLEHDLESRGPDESLLKRIESQLRVFVPEETRRQACLQELRALTPAGCWPGPQATDTVTIPVREDADVVRARNSAREMAREVGFVHTEQIKIATAVSEIARNIVRYAGEGLIRLRALDAPCAGVEIAADDGGPGITDLEAVLGGEFKSKTGMGLGLRGSRRLMDDFQVRSAPGEGTHVVMRKLRR